MPPIVLSFIAFSRSEPSTPKAPECVAHASAPSHDSFRVCLSLHILSPLFLCSPLPPPLLRFAEFWPDPPPPPSNPTTHSRVLNIGPTPVWRCKRGSPPLYSEPSRVSYFCRKYKFPRIPPFCSFYFGRSSDNNSRGPFTGLSHPTFFQGFQGGGSISQPNLFSFFSPQRLHVRPSHDSSLTTT